MQLAPNASYLGVAADPSHLSEHAPLHQAGLHKLLMHGLT